MSNLSFNTQINEDHTINIPYMNNMSLAYARKYVVHNQVMNNDIPVTVNLCSYTGERTYQNICTSITRELNNLSIQKILK